MLQFLRKIASHPLRHIASAFEVCCHVELRHVLYFAAEIVCNLQMRHAKGRNKLVSTLYYLVLLFKLLGYILFFE